jgi:putative peptidoglycan lipid II flippase
MRTPVRIAVLAMVANILFNILLIWPLQHAGIALATSLAAILNMSFLFTQLKRRGYYSPQPGWGIFALRIIFANFALAFWLWIGAGDLSIWVSQHAMWRIEHLAILLTVAALVYFVSLWISGLRLHHFLIRE